MESTCPYCGCQFDPDDDALYYCGPPRDYTGYCCLGCFLVGPPLLDPATGVSEPTDTSSGAEGYAPDDEKKAEESSPADKNDTPDGM